MWPELRKFASGIPLLGPVLRAGYRKALKPNPIHTPPSTLRERPDKRTHLLDPAYHGWILRRVAARASDYPAPNENPPAFDIVTLTYETDPEILMQTAQSVFAQDYKNFRWVIWDNASTKPQTLKKLDDLARRPNVVVQRSAENLGIARGHQKALELCSNEYVALLDHDDLLYPDALKIMAWSIARYGRPDMLYSDEDKCDMQDNRFFPYLKPDYSPALLLDTAYTCHLSVAKLEKLRACGAFSDAAVEGTQDWDMALRMADAGCSIVHVPEILYTWRAVTASTAVEGVSAKPYVVQSQLRCVEASLARRKLRERFEVRANPLFPVCDGHWWAQRNAQPNGSAAAPLIDILLVARDDDGIVDFSSALSSAIDKTNYPNFRVRVLDATNSTAVAQLSQSAIQSVGTRLSYEPSSARPVNCAGLINAALQNSPAGQRAADFIALLPAGALLESGDWLWEAIGCFEASPNALLVGGRMFSPEGMALGGAAVFGMSGSLDIPYSFEPKNEPGYFCMNYCRRNVSAVLYAPWVVRRESAAGILFDAEFPHVYFEADFCARARRNGFEIVFSPFIAAQGQRAKFSAQEEAAEAYLLKLRHIELVRDDPYYSPFGSLDKAFPYCISESSERAGYINARMQHLRVDSGQNDRFHDAPQGKYELERYAKSQR